MDAESFFKAHQIFQTHAINSVSLVIADSLCNPRNDHVRLQVSCIFINWRPRCPDPQQPWGLMKALFTDVLEFTKV